MFFLYLARAHSPQLFRQIWDAAADEQSSYNAIDRGLKNGGISQGLRQVWPKFARAIWNLGPVTDFQKWDKLHDSAFTLQTPPKSNLSHRDVIEIGDKEFYTVFFTQALQPLSSQHYHFRFIDEAARSVRFQNNWVSSMGDEDPVQVRALLRMEGETEWREEPWTNIHEPKFCRDMKKERIEELVIIFSNSDHEDSEPAEAFQAPRLSVSNVGCWQWVGTSELAELTDKALNPAGAVNITATTTMRFGGRPVGPADIELSVIEATAAWKVDAWLADVCTARGEGVLSIPVGSETSLIGQLEIWPFQEGSQRERSYAGVVVLHPSTPREPRMVTWKCKPDFPTLVPFPVSFSPWVPGLTPEGSLLRKVNRDGITIDGELPAIPGDPLGRTISYKWHFEAQRE